MSFKKLQSIAYEFVEVNKLKYHFNREKRMSGKEWVVVFCKILHFSVRQPEKVSTAGAIGSNVMPEQSALK